MLLPAMAGLLIITGLTPHISCWSPQSLPWFQGYQANQSPAHVNLIPNGRLVSVNDIHAHQTWHEVLQAHVNNQGMVDYAAIKKEPSKLNRYLSMLEQNPVQDQWDRSQKLAYWINAYNAFTVKLIIDNYPLKSIRDIDRPWGKKFIQLGNQSYSLNQIEHDIIRPDFDEPRIHFALVCAAVSCPRLLNQAYVPDKLDQQLELQTRYFLNQSGKNKLGSEKVSISKLFNWYTKDFTAQGTVIDFLNQYSSVTITSNAKVDYQDYDWSLNDSQ